jgi:hypothetical protein
MLGYCWPSVLAQLLAFCSADFVAKLLSGIEAVLIEVPAEEDAWQLFARPECQATLEQFGFLSETGH